MFLKVLALGLPVSFSLIVPSFTDRRISVLNTSMRGSLAFVNIKKKKVLWCFMIKLFINSYETINQILCITWCRLRFTFFLCGRVTVTLVGAVVINVRHRLNKRAPSWRVQTNDANYHSTFKYSGSKHFWIFHHSPSSKYFYMNMFCHFRLLFLHIFCSFSPGRRWMCFLTCSVETESRSLSMDTVSKLQTGTPIKETDSIKSQRINVQED